MILRVAWDDKQYLKFADERTRAAVELLARVQLDDPRFIVDLGCGPGNSTALLRARWPGTRIMGVDNSETMLERARRDLPEVEWVRTDARDFRPATAPDLLFANAVLHWLPDHEGLVPELFARLRPGGVLAIQMPRSFDEPIHRLMRELEATKRSRGDAALPDHVDWPARLRGVRPFLPVAAPASYYDLLAPDAERVDVWQTIYEHVMPDVASIVEWAKGTGIRPYLETLTPDEQQAYLTDYADALEAAYPPRSDGRRLLTFPRIFIVAMRK